MVAAVRARHASACDPFVLERSTVMHVARGEQLNPSYFSELCKPDYCTALAYVSADEPLVIVTDDPQWCRAHPLLRHALIVDEPYEPYALCLLTQFSRHILAHSLLGWWGAALSGTNDSSSSQIVAPSRWFRGTGCLGPFNLPGWREYDAAQTADLSHLAASSDEELRALISDRAVTPDVKYEACLYLGNRMNQSRKTLDAIAMFERGSKYNVGRVECMLGIMSTLYQQGKFAEIRCLYKQWPL